MADSEETVLEEDNTETAGGGGAQVQEEQQGQAQQEAGAGEGGRTGKGHCNRGCRSILRYLGRIGVHALSFVIVICHL